MIKKIISGGQTGADRAALDAAIKSAVPHGGWIPKGRKTENGLLPEKYKMQEMEDSQYISRTRQNVIDSDGTLIISNGELTGGSEYTRQMAGENDRPLLHVDLAETDLTGASDSIREWIAVNRIGILNVAGPRESKDPMIYHAVFDILNKVLAQN